MCSLLAWRLDSSGVGRLEKRLRLVVKEEALLLGRGGALSRLKVLGTPRLQVENMLCGVRGWLPVCECACVCRAIPWERHKERRLMSENALPESAFRYMKTRGHAGNLAWGSWSWLFILRWAGSAFQKETIKYILERAQKGPGKLGDIPCCWLETGSSEEGMEESPRKRSLNLGPANSNQHMLPYLAQSFRNSWQKH